MKHAQHAKTLRGVKRARVNKLAAEILRRAGETPDPDQQPVLQLAEWGLNHNLGSDRPGEGFALGQHLAELMTYTDQVKVFNFLTMEEGQSNHLAETLQVLADNPQKAARFLLEHLLLTLRAAGHEVR